MNKTKKIIITIILALLIIIPISTLALTGFILPNTDKEAIEEGNKKNNERMLKEKEQYAKDHSNDIPETSINTNTFSEEELEKFEKEKRELAEKENKIKSVMNKYYEKEFNQILDDIANSPNFQGVLKNNYIAPEEIKLYEIIMKTLEENNLSDEDSQILKDFLEQQRDTINKNTKLKERADRILQ